MSIKKFKVLERFVNKLNTKETFDPNDAKMNVISLDDEKDAARIEELSKHPDFRGKTFIAPLEDGDLEAVEYPHHVGGGTYELSNGEKVKGKEEALKAEEALTGEEAAE